MRGAQGSGWGTGSGFCAGRGSGPWLRLVLSKAAFSKASVLLSPSKLPFLAFSCSTVFLFSALGYKSSKALVCEPKIPSQLSPIQPSWPNSCVPKAISRAVFTPYTLVGWVPSQEGHSCIPGSGFGNLQGPCALFRSLGVGHCFEESGMSQDCLLL